MAIFVGLFRLVISPCKFTAANKLTASYNVSYDPASRCIVGLIDFNFAFVYHPIHEYMESFHMMKGDLQDSEHIEATSLRSYTNACKRRSSFDDIRSIPGRFSSLCLRTLAPEKPIKT